MMTNKFKIGFTSPPKVPKVNRAIIILGYSFYHEEPRL